MIRRPETIRRAFSTAGIVMTLRARSSVSILSLSRVQLARLTGNPRPIERPRRLAPSFEMSLPSLPTRAGLGGLATGTSCLWQVFLAKRKKNLSGAAYIGQERENIRITKDCCRDGRYQAGRGERKKRKMEEGGYKPTTSAATTEKCSISGRYV